jgi:sugar porter (SP) family MFS transporter
VADDDPPSPPHVRRQAFLIGGIASLAGLLFGLDTGFVSGLAPRILETFGIAGEDLRAKVVYGLVVGAVPLGAVLGAAISSPWVKRCGPKTTIIWCSILFFLGVVLSAVAPVLALLVVGRLIMGVALGVAATIVPMYLSEVSPPSIRGAVVILFQLEITIGLVLGSVINYFWAAQGNWRLLEGFVALPAVILFLGMLGRPESPRWLVLADRHNEAEKELLRLSGRDDVSAELLEIEESLGTESGRLSELFSRSLFPLVVISLSLFVFTGMSGIDVVMYYGPKIFSEAGFGETTKFIAQMLMGLTNVLLTFVGAWVVDRLGRRPLLLIGCTGMAVTLLILGLLLKVEAADDLEAFLSLGSVILFISFFAVSLGGIPYLIMSEVFPLKARGPGMAVASCANWAMVAVTTLAFEPLALAVGMGNVFLIFAASMVAGVVFCYRYIPETRGRTLEQIEANLHAGKALRYLGDPVQP